MIVTSTNLNKVRCYREQTPIPITFLLNLVTLRTRTTKCQDQTAGDSNKLKTIRNLLGIDSFLSPSLATDTTPSMAEFTALFVGLSGKRGRRRQWSEVCAGVILVRMPCATISVADNFKLLRAGTRKTVFEGDILFMVSVAVLLVTVPARSRWYSRRNRFICFCILCNFDLQLVPRIVEPPVFSVGSHGRNATATMLRGTVSERAPASPWRAYKFSVANLTPI